MSVLMYSISSQALPVVVPGVVGMVVSAEDGVP
jgi:hypothetical protein